MFLEEDDLTQFTRLHWQLLFFVNEKADLFDYFSDFSDFQDLLGLDIEDKMELFTVFYEKPVQYIDAYLAQNPDSLEPGELEIIESWKSLRSGEFVIFRQLKKHAVVLGAGDDQAAYAVLGLTEPLENVVNRFVPALVETALFPFKGMIVSDGLMRQEPYAYTGYGKKMLNQQYKAAKSGPGLVSQLSPLGIPKHKPTAAERVARLAEKLRASLDSIRTRRNTLRNFKDNIEPVFQQWLVKAHGDQQQRLTTLKEETERLAQQLHRAQMSWQLREFQTKAKTLDAVEKEIDEEGEIFRSAAEGTSDDQSDHDGDAPYSDSPFDGIPPFLIDSMLEELLRETRGIDPSQLSAKALEKARQDLLNSMNHATSGDRGALEKSLLKIGADDSEKNRAAVTKLFRRLARQVHPDHNDDFGDEAKEIWEELQQHRDALDLEALESLEMRWRLIRSDRFNGRDEKRLKQLRIRLVDEELDLDLEIDQHSNHPMWGKKSTKTPARSVQKRIKRDFESAIGELEAEKAQFEQKLATFRSSSTKKKKKQRSATGNKTPTRKTKTTKKKPKADADADADADVEPELPDNAQSTFDFG